MTLDEAIKDSETISEECQRVVDTGIVFGDVTIDMLYCDNAEEELAKYKQTAENYRQLAEWLKELKQLREQKPKTGQWEWVQYDANPNIGNWHCSECRTIIPHMPEEIDNTPIYKWCPMCGSKMQEVEE